MQEKSFYISPNHTFLINRVLPRPYVHPFRHSCFQHPQKAAQYTKTFSFRSLKEEEGHFSEEPFGITALAAPLSGRNSRHESSYVAENFWVGHCIINNRKLSREDNLEVTMDLHQSASDFPQKLLNGGGHLSTLSLIHRSLPHR